MDASMEDDSFLEWEEWKPDQGTFLAHMIAGSIAGITEHTIMYPVDTLKTHVQCDRCGKVASPGLGGNVSGCIHALKTLVRTEGLFRLWRGVNTMIVACVPAHAAYFSVYETIKERSGANKPGHHPLAAASAGMFGTLAHDLIMNPMDTVKQRLQLGYYKGITHCVSQMIRYEGISSFYVSLPTTLTMNLPFGAILVTSNESLKKLLAGPDGKHTVGTYLLASSGAGAIASLATTPFDMIKTRLQTQHFRSPTFKQHHSALTGAMPSLPTTLQPSRSAMTMASAGSPSTGSTPGHSHVRLKGALECARTIYTEAGVTGFWRGGVPRLFVAIPSVTVSWTTYEMIKSMLQDRV